MLIMRMDVLLLGFMGPSVGVSLSTIGIFVASVEISGGMRKVRQAFDPMFTPIIARQSALQDRAAMEQSFAQLGRWVLAAQLPLMGVLCLAGGIGLDIFGPGFRAGSLWVALLAIAHATNSFVGLAETVIMIERPKLNLINSGATVVLQLGASLLLIPWLGATGAALGMVLAYVTQGVLRYLELRFLFNWHWPWRALARPAARVRDCACAVAVAAAAPDRRPTWGVDRPVLVFARGLRRRVETDRPGRIRSRRPSAALEKAVRAAAWKATTLPNDCQRARAASSCSRRLRAAPCPFGVSSTFGILRKRRSRMMQRNAGSPILPFADMLVPIDARAARRLRVVQMQRGEPLEPDDAIEFGEHLPRRSFGREIVAGLEDVRGIETDAEPFRLAHVLDDVRDLLEAVAETRALAGGRLERDLAFSILRQARRAPRRSTRRSSRAPLLRRRRDARRDAARETAARVGPRG